MTISTGEPLMNMWAKGKQRMLPGRGGWLDISDARNPVFLKSDARVGGCIAYNTKLKKWLAMSSAGAPITSSRPGFPHGQHHPEERARSNAYAGLRGIRTFDITDPTKPQLLQEYSIGTTGWGTHMNFYDGGKYAFLAARWDDLFFFENTQRV